MNKGLFVIIGECFRKGNQGTRTKGSPDSYFDQKKAIESHIFLINFLEKKYKIKIDIVLNSYSTIYNDEIINWYKNNIIKYNFLSDYIGYPSSAASQAAMYKSAINLIEGDNYEFIFVFRIDLVFKKYFTKVFDAKSNKILFPSVLAKNWAYDNHEFPRINETMVFVPKNHFKLFFDFTKIPTQNLLNPVWFGDHYFLSKNKNIIKHIDYFLDTFHDSDSRKDWNPVYRIANREECKIWHSRNFICQDHKQVFNKLAGKDYFLKHL